MAYLSNFASLRRLHRRLVTSIPTQFPPDRYPSTIASSLSFLLFVHPCFSAKRWLSSNAEWADPPDFTGMNAYDVLGVSPTSSYEEIKASFRKLAKETHPDLVHSQNHSSFASKNFIQILAAYEVKHLHWFRVGEKISVCECRCSRARLPPSKYWLFEPRSAMHDIGGWYVETFGRDNKGKTVPAQRYWDNLDTNPQVEEKLHPAIYLLTLAYRTLDIEDSRIRKNTIKGKVEAEISRAFSWFKKIV